MRAMPSKHAKNRVADLLHGLVAHEATMEHRARFKLDLALVRTLLDEVERGLDHDDGVASQLLDELQRLTAALAKANAPESEKRVRDVA
jgi:hypothetical protein